MRLHWVRMLRRRRRHAVADERSGGGTSAHCAADPKAYADAYAESELSTSAEAIACDHACTVVGHDECTI